MDQSPAPSATTSGPLPAYRAQIGAGALVADSAQALAAERLQDLWVKLRRYDPPPGVPAEGFFSRLMRRKPVDDAQDRPHGLYLVGEVGRGKSMLMDMFFASADVARKRRVHFHRFMQDAHARFHAFREAGEGDDPIPKLADVIAADAALLCLDEFQVNDIADAMILGRLFQALFDRGVVVVATSNTLPRDLFAGQPGRDAFLPFIALIEQHLEVLVLEGGRDFRRDRLHRMQTWHAPADARAERAMDAAFLDLTGGEPGAPSRLTVSGRTLAVPLAARGVARFDFAALCAQPLGPGDYLAIATHFHTLLIDAIPCLHPGNHDEARRFITLVDTLYDHRVKLIASADALPDQLYERGDGARAFERTASRLIEMQSEDWMELAHLT